MVLDKPALDAKSRRLAADARGGERMAAAPALEHFCHCAETSSSGPSSDLLPTLERLSVPSDLLLAPAQVRPPFRHELGVPTLALGLANRRLSFLRSLMAALRSLVVTITAPTGKAVLLLRVGRKVRLRLGLPAVGAANVVH